jgi:hypothetical protein
MVAKPRVTAARLPGILTNASCRANSDAGNNSKSWIDNPSTDSSSTTPSDRLSSWCKSKSNYHTLEQANHPDKLCFRNSTKSWSSRRSRRRALLSYRAAWQTAASFTARVALYTEKSGPVNKPAS